MTQHNSRLHLKYRKNNYKSCSGKKTMCLFRGKGNKTWTWRSVCPFLVIRCFWCAQRVVDGFLPLVKYKTSATSIQHVNLLADVLVEDETVFVAIYYKGKLTGKWEREEEVVSRQARWWWWKGVCLMVAQWHNMKVGVGSIIL